MTIKDLFYQNIRENVPININFNIKVIEANDENRTMTVSLIPDGERWVQREIDGKQVYYDKIEDMILPIDAFVEGFEKYKNIHGHDLPLTIKEYNSPKGTTSIHGIENLIKLNRIEEAFLSCHSLFRHRIRVLVYFFENSSGVDVDVSTWEKFKEKNKNTGPLIEKLKKYLPNVSISKSDFEAMESFNRDRNTIDHEMGEGKVDYKLIVNTIKKGIFWCNKAEIIFKELTERNTSRKTF